MSDHYIKPPRTATGSFTCVSTWDTPGPGRLRTEHRRVNYTNEAGAKKFARRFKLAMPTPEERAAEIELYNKRAAEAEAANAAYARRFA